MFTEQQVEDRMRDMRRIAKLIIEHYQSDLDHDHHCLQARPHAPTWLWFPYASGTHIAPHLPAGRDWMRALIDYYGPAGREQPTTPYLITPHRVTKTTWRAARERYERITDPTYVIKLAKDQAGLLTTRDLTEARNTWAWHPEPCLIFETSEPHPVFTVENWVAINPDRRAAA